MRVLVATPQGTKAGHAWLQGPARHVASHAVQNVDYFVDRTNQ